MNKKLISILLASSMLVTLSACSTGEDTAYIAQVGEEQIPAGVYSYGLINSYSAAAGMVIDPNKDMFDQTIDGIATEDWIVNETLDSMKAFIAVNEEFERLGLELTEEEIELAAVQANAEWETYGSIYEENGISKETIVLLSENNAKSQHVYEAYYSEDGEKQASEEEIKAYYDENYARVNQLLIEKQTTLDSGETVPLSGEALMAVRDQANSYYDRLSSGENFNEIMLEFQTEKAANEGTEYEADFEVEDPYAHDLIISKTQMYFEPDYLSQVFVTEVGGYGLYERDEYYIIFAREDLYEDPQDFEDRKENLGLTVAGTNYRADLLAAAEAIDIVMNDKAVAAFGVDDINL